MEPMTQTQVEVENFFARADLEFIDCPICTRPLLKQACDDRKRKRGHWDIREGQEVDVVGDYFRLCDGCKHFQPHDRKDGKLTKHERLARYGVGRDEAARLKKREQIKMEKLTQK